MCHFSGARWPETQEDDRQPAVGLCLLTIILIQPQLVTTGLTLIQWLLGSHKAMFHNPHLMEQPDGVDSAIDFVVFRGGVLGSLLEQQA